MKIRFLNHWRAMTHEGGLNPIYTFVLFNVWYWRYDQRSLGCAPVIGLGYGIGANIFNFGAEVTW